MIDFQTLNENPTILHVDYTYVFIDVSQKVHTIENKIQDQVLQSSVTMSNTMITK